MLARNNIENASDYESKSINYSDTSANEDNSFRNHIRQPKQLVLSGVSLLAVSNVNNPVGLVGLPYVLWSAHFFVTYIQTEKISSWNGPTVHVCCFMLARASTKTFVSRIHIRQPSPKNSEKNLLQPKNSLAGSLVSRGITVHTISVIQSNPVKTTKVYATPYLPVQRQLFCGTS